MASLLLSAGGAALGGALFGPAGAIVGRLAGAIGGNMLDRSLFGNGPRERHVEGPRLAALDVMASSEGAAIPRVYGRARLSGQVIWATSLEEVVTTRVETQGGGGKGFGDLGGGSAAQTVTTETTYSYFANFAVGLCEGPVGRVLRIWADGKLLDQAGLTIRFHSGAEDQAADPLIVAKEGATSTPAYRGLAYVVFERLPLAPFGNRIPQLSFEIANPAGTLEQMIRAVTLIPGATEFGYEPSTVTRVLGPGASGAENRHTTLAGSDVVAALDELQALCPALERVSLVVAWFGDDLRANHCVVRPAVDNRDKVTSGAPWSVAGRTRGDAWLVSQIGGRAAYGGTPSDDSVKNLIAHLHARGLKVTLYPFVMMDIAAGNALPDPWTGAASQPAYPWRGRITCDPAPGQAGTPDGSAGAATQIDNFFGADSAGANSYREMILHYARLAMDAGGVDAFLIGSELRGLTRVRAASGVYPAVNALATLAAEVRAVVGAGTKISYGADWTEYGAHVVDAAAQEVRFPLDALWASSAIDAVGIDYYAPLSDWRGAAGEADRALAGSIYDHGYLAGNLRGGEGFDWYYADDLARADQTRTPITDGLGKPWTFRAKDIWNWWASPHVQRVGGVETVATSWVPQSKPIWLTEIGVPAVDKGSNQPSVFADSKSSESALPYFSTGARDDAIQRAALQAALGRLDPAFGASLADNPVSTVYGGRMIDMSAAAVWTWDARPFPAFPAALDVWGDGGNWYTGHWLTGRLGGAPLADLVQRLLADNGLAGHDAAALRGTVDGYVIDRPMSLRAMIEPLAQVFQFNATDDAGTLRFRARGGAAAIDIAEDDLAEHRGAARARLARAQESDLPRAAALIYTDPGRDYRRAVATSRRLAGAAAGVSHADHAIVMQPYLAATRAEILLQDLWAGREEIEFYLPPSAARLQPGDVAALNVGGLSRLVEIGEIVDAETRHLRGRSIDPDGLGDAPAPVAPFVAPALPSPEGAPLVHVLDLPTLDSQTPEVLARLAIFADPWPGAVAVWRSRSGETFERIATAAAPAVIGETLDALPRGPGGRWHRIGFRVRLAGGALSAIGQRRVLDGGNAAALQRPDGAWEIIQFSEAELVAPGEWRLSMLLRGQAGSEHAMGDPLAAGAPFVLLDSHLVSVARGLSELDRDSTLRVVAAGRDVADPSAVTLTLQPRATALMPLSPVHITGARQAGGVALRWVRRSRRDADSWTGEVPLGEDAEAYEIDILDGANVRRTLRVATPSALYASADEIADFGAAQSTLSLRVHQISATAGRGFAASATLTL